MTSQTIYAPNKRVYSCTIFVMHLGQFTRLGKCIALIYQHGGFHAESTDGTAAALFFYALGLYGYSGVKVFAPAFYAFDQVRVPVLASFAGMAVGMLAGMLAGTWLAERVFALLRPLTSARTA